MKLKTIVKGTGDNKYTSNKISSQFYPGSCRHWQKAGGRVKRRREKYSCPH